MAGYDPNQVRDEKGPAKWVGSGLPRLGFGLLVGGLIYLLPSDSAFLPAIVLAAVQDRGIGQEKICRAFLLLVRQPLLTLTYINRLAGEVCAAQPARSGAV